MTVSAHERLSPSHRALVRVVSAGAAAVALAVQLPGALQNAFWQDEVASARVISEPHALGMLRHVARTESAPPLWYALGWLLHRSGLGVADVRLLSVVAGAALAAAVVRCAEQFVPLWAAGIAGLGVAVGYQFVFHARELRAYELAAGLAMALAVAAAHAVESPTRRPLALLAATVAAGTLTHYFFVFSVGFVALWLRLVPLGRRERRQLLAALGAGLAPLAAWSPVLLQQTARNRFAFIGPFRLRDVATTYWFFFARARPQTPLLHEAAPLAVLAVVLVGAVVLYRRSVTGRLWALLAVGPVLAAAVLWLAGLRIYDVRNLIVCAPFAAVGAVAAARGIARPAAVTTTATVAAALLLVGFAEADRVRPVAYDRIAAALVAGGWRTGDPVLVRGAPYALAAPLEWYLPGRPRLQVVRSAPVGAHRCFVVQHSTVARSSCHVARSAVLVSEGGDGRGTR